MIVVPPVIRRWLYFPRITQINADDCSSSSYSRINADDCGPQAPI